MNGGKDGVVGWFVSLALRLIGRRRGARDTWVEKDEENPESYLDTPTYLRRGTVISWEGEVICN